MTKLERVTFTRFHYVQNLDIATMSPGTKQHESLVVWPGKRALVAIGVDIAHLANPACGEAASNPMIRQYMIL